MINKKTSNMILGCYCLIVTLLLFSKAYGYCVFNQSPTKLQINLFKSLYAYGDRLPIKIKKSIQSGNHICCHWQNNDCFVPHSFEDEKEWTNRVVPVACSKYNKVFTNVETPRGGYLVVKESLNPLLDNLVEIYGFDKTRMDFWYSCGSKNKKFYYA